MVGEFMYECAYNQSLLVCGGLDEVIDGVISFKQR